VEGKQGGSYFLPCWISFGFLGVFFCRRKSDFSFDPFMSRNLQRFLDRRGHCIFSLFSPYRSPQSLRLNMVFRSLPFHFFSSGQTHFSVTGWFSVSHCLVLMETIGSTPSFPLFDFNPRIWRPLFGPLLFPPPLIFVVRSGHHKSAIPDSAVKATPLNRIPEGSQTAFSSAFFWPHRARHFSSTSLLSLSIFFSPFALGYGRPVQVPFIPV